MGKMKKFLLFLILFVGIVFAAYADEGRGSCIVKGTQNDYVEVTAYSDGKGQGNFVISNSSSKPLVSVYIRVTADVEHKTVQGRYENIILFSGNYTEGVEPYQSKNVLFSFPAGRGIRNISVEVNNPTCVSNK